MKRPLLILGLLIALIFLVAEGYSPPPQEKLQHILSGSTEVLAEGIVKSISDNSFILKKVYLNHQKISYNLTIKYEGAVKVGQKVSLEGRISFFDAADNEGQSDMRAYYKSINIAGQIKDAKIIAASREYSHVYELFRLAKDKVIARIDHVYAGDYAGVVRAVLTGDKSGVKAQMKTLFRESGIIHILSVSGLHISIIGNGLFLLLKKLKADIRAAALVSGTVMLLFGFFTGFPISAVRACGCFLISAPAILLRRSYDSMSALGLVGIIILFANPHIIYNSGFILSFTSAFGIHVVYRTLEPATGMPSRKLSDRLFVSIRSAFLSGFSISLFTLPIILSLYYEFSPWSVFLNMFVIPTMGIFMVTALISLIPGLGILGTVNVCLIDVYSFLSKMVGRLPGGIVITGCPRKLKAVLFYLILFASLRVLKGVYKKERKEKVIIGKTIICYAGIAASLMVLLISFGEKSINFLYTGQGDMNVILNGRKCVIIDAGSSTEKNAARDLLVPFLKFHGISKVEAVFLSHSDEDHINAARDLLEKEGEYHIKVAKVFLPGGMAKAVMDFEKIPVDKAKYLAAGDEIKFGKYEISVLAPSRIYKPMETNEGSMVLLVKKEGDGVLFCGDIEGDGERYLTALIEQNDVGKISVLKVAHHGSKYSTSEDFLRVVRAESAVISCGRRNSYGHPHAETIERLQKFVPASKVFRTDECGQVKVIFDKKKLKIMSGAEHLILG